MKTETTWTSFRGLGAVILRTWRIKLARVFIKAGRGLLTAAEWIFPGDLRQ